MRNVFGLLFVALVVSGCSPAAPDPEASASAPALAAPTVNLSEQRIQDLVAIHNALEEYAKGNAGKYPVSEGLQGYRSEWGRSAGAEWIPELKTVLPSLPRDPAKSDNPQQAQYLYKSDGKDYKLIVHQSGDCTVSVERNGVKVDPMRVKEANCWGYGFWSPGGESF